MVALLARVWMSARSSSMPRFVLRVSVGDEQLIQPAARDLYVPVCWDGMFIRSARSLVRGESGTDLDTGDEGVGPGVYGIAVVGRQQSLDHSRVFGRPSVSKA